MLILVGTSIVSLSQIVFPYQDIKLENPADFKGTEPMALSAATFLLSTPFIEFDKKRAGVLQFLSKWMTGAKNYNFYMEGLLQDLGTDKNLLSLYIAAMAKYSLENKSESIYPLKVERNASITLLIYCDDLKNNFKLKNKYRKLIEDKISESK